MKYALTGHTEGIGKALFQKLEPNVIGFSRTSGYDICNPNDRKRIIEEADDCDVFINNAHCHFGQTELLLDLFKSWQKRNKTIINVGSRVADVKLTEDRYHLLNYQAEKRILKYTAHSLHSDTCKILYKSFGYVGTEKILTTYPNFTKDDFITIEEAVEIILLQKSHIIRG